MQPNQTSNPTSNPGSGYMVFGTSTKPNNQGKGEEEKMENKKIEKLKRENIKNEKNGKY